MGKERVSNGKSPRNSRLMESNVWRQSRVSVLISHTRWLILAGIIFGVNWDADIAF